MYIPTYIPTHLNILEFIYPNLHAYNYILTFIDFFIIHTYIHKKKTFVHNLLKIAYLIRLILLILFIYIIDFCLLKRVSPFLNIQMRKLDSARDYA